MGKEYVRAFDDLSAKKEILEFYSQGKATSLISSAGVAYRLKDIQHYLTNILPEIQQRHLDKMGGTLPSGHEWGLGYMWKYGQDANGKTGLGFFIIPVLVDAGGGVLDYFGSDSYHHPNTTDNRNNIYDEGNLFP